MKLLKKIIIVAVAVLVSLYSLNFVRATDSSSTNFLVTDSVMKMADGFSTSTNFQIWSSLGQDAVGFSTTTSFSLQGGFLYFLGIPPAPSSLTATAVSQTQIDLSWLDNSINNSGFKIERSLTSGSGFAQITTTAANAVSYSDTGLNAGTTYFYRISAFNSDGNSDYSSEINATTQSAATVASGGGGGVGLPPEWNNPPTPPAGGFKVLINNNATETNSLIIVLNLIGGPNTEKMAISNFSDFRDASQEQYVSIKQWNLCQGFNSCLQGTYTIYAKFYAPWGKSSEVVSASIVFNRPSLITRIEQVITPLLPPFLRPKQPTTKPPVVITVPKLAPLAFQTKWNLLPVQAIREFVFAPLPEEFKSLAAKFPSLAKTFEQVGIARITDIQKLINVQMTLPGLTERVGLPTTKVEPGKFALPEGVPIANLSAQVKQQMPTEIVFVKVGGQLIDFNIALTLSDKGEAQQTITTIVGKTLELSVKPDHPVNRIDGYVVFKSKNPPQSSIQVPFSQLAASAIFATPVLTKPQEAPVPIEEKLVLEQFEYTDPDGDGIYTAEIQAPVIDGQYEIITVFNYKDIKLANKELRLVAVVDPEGYVFEKQGDKETRIPGAIISLFWLNPQTKQYELWPAGNYQQENPQTTDIRGTYSFLVPNGFYYLKVETPGYLTYDGKPFEVTESSGIHVNIELKTQYWWLNIIDWKTVLLIVVILLMLYNFYKDRLREKLLAKT